MAPLTDFDIKLGAAPTLAASVNGASPKVAIVDLDLGNATTQVSGLTVTVGGAVAKLGKAASDTLTSVFGTPSTDGATLGTAVVTATVR